ncbi:4-hydroxythreonine-4-phosphate dehydrogenase PdxA [Luteimonas qiangzhengi]|uniref:4-hydroxythreonine-4-phosphate dehydrogenase PdxA n=1 Tax=Luteimonas sp. MJ146 TaxID=3129240 RepID=UPI0031BB5CF7
MARPRLALVPGEPAGVGPELCVAALQRDFGADITIYGDRASLARAADLLDLPLSLEGTGPGRARLIEVAHPRLPDFGSPDPANAASVIGALRQATDACQRGEIDGMVTGPVHKAAINAGGIAYSGTTGLLAEWTGREVVMMLANKVLRVALATTHLPLREVADVITAPALERTLRILHAAMQADFGISRPRIAVLGLNPHAGEDGHLGHEEIDVIQPVLEQLRGDGMDLQGPLPADTAFLPEKLREVDAVLAMYHDQGLPVLKHSGFEHAVNLTLGLPWPRVAVDHGTALDLAGSGRATASSLIAALDTCARLAATRQALRAGTPA